MWFPTADQVIRMHDEIIERTGGEPGLIRRGPIEAAIERARWGPFPGQEDLAVRAALLMRGLAQDHPFVDGNKRTAFETVLTFLDRNGYRLETGDEDVTTFMVDLARGDVSLRQVREWIRDRMRKD